MFEVNVKNMTEGKGGGPAQVWGFDDLSNQPEKPGPKLDG